MTSLFPVTRQKIEKQREKLKRDKLTPWFWYNSRGIKVTRFDGETIDLSGDFNANLFLDFIKPFLKDAIVKTLDETLEICHTRGLEPEEPYIRETAMLLDGYLIDPIYQYMATIDQRIRGKGNPKSVRRRNVTEYIEEMRYFLNESKDQFIQGIETNTKPQGNGGQAKKTISGRLTKFFFKLYEVTLKVIVDAVLGRF